MAFSPLAHAQTESRCGDLRNAFGPYDYRKERGNQLYLVESAHFTPMVEGLIAGSTGRVGADIDYTLRAFPNHHRALLAMMRLGEKTKTDQPDAAHFPVECYFDRALRFAPDDTTARMLYATYLGKKGRLEEANKQLDDASQLAGENSFTHYNAGLVYFELKNYAGALREAQRAYALGFMRPELRDLLKGAGHWVEPVAAAASAPASDAASAPAAAASAAP
jgi:tetratricopeptide (TPR) repeat protein